LPPYPVAAHQLIAPGGTPPTRSIGALAVPVGPLRAKCKRILADCTPPRALSLVLRNLGHFCWELSAIPNYAAPDPIRGGVLIFEKDRAAVQVEVADGNAEYNQRGA